MCGCFKILVFLKIGKKLMHKKIEFSKMDDGVEICYMIFEMLRGFGAWKMVKKYIYF